MYYEKKMKPRMYYINVFLRNWSFILAFHNGYYDKLVIVSMSVYPAEALHQPDSSWRQSTEASLFLRLSLQTCSGKNISAHLKSFMIQASWTCRILSILNIANAFEEVIREKTPRFHRAVRSFYDRYGFPVAKVKRKNGRQMWYI